MGSDVRPNPELALAAGRNDTCALCPRSGLTSTERDVCVTGAGNARATVAVVSKTLLGPRARAELETYLVEAGVDTSDVAWLSAVKCRADAEPTKTNIKACRVYLDRELAHVRPKWTLSLGNEALTALTGHSGIMKYRGGIFDHASGSKVFATIAPAMVHRQPGLLTGFRADLAYLAAKVHGVDLVADHTPAPYTEVWTKAGLRKLADALSTCDGMSFDVETAGWEKAAEFGPEASVVTLALTLWTGDVATTWGVPLSHPESPWASSWRRVLRWLGPHLRKPRRRIAHNGKYDCRWLRRFGVHVTLTWDTMISGYMLDENRQKGLKPRAQQQLGAEPWAMDTSDIMAEPLSDVLDYNVADTWHTWRLYKLDRAEMMQPANARTARLFARLMMPASESYVDIEQFGVWVDTESLATNTAVARAELEAVRERLYAWVPAEHPFVVRNKRTGELRDDGVNFNPSNFLRWWLFEHLGLPVLARGKAKEDGSPGDPSAAEAVMLELAEQHEVPRLLLEHTKWYKIVHSFFEPYAAQLDSNDRIHTTFKLTGTVTGRLSSGKEDVDKITSRKQTRGVNLQQVPRDKFVRGVFGAPPGSSFVEADYSQIELRVAAFLARETNMLHLYNTGQDIHMSMAMRMTGKPANQVTKEERKRAKAVNFGFLYGMGVLKFIATAWSNYGVRVTPEESEAFRVAFFTQFPALLPWHARQRRLVNEFGRVESPLGRVRHLPDIYSPDRQVRAEAERQAINSPVQSFASDLAVLSLVDIDRRFRDLGLRARPIGTVHDAVNFELPNAELAVALPIIKDTMEDTDRLARRFGVVLDVPIVADLKVGARWGGAREIEPEEVYAWAG